MKLDLRNPTLIFLGAWNPAIFQPSWVAKYLHDIPEGERISASQVTVLAPAGPRHIIFINNVGLAASTDRVEIFLNADSDAAREHAENVAIRLLSVLPHTPLGGFGVNDHYLEADPEADLLDKFVTSEKINEHYKILGRSFSSALEMDDGVTLNFSRKVSESEIIFDFNYHYARIDRNSIEPTLSGILKKHLDSSLESLAKLYDLNEYEALTHEFHTPAEITNQN
jgi:hypothetical protein